MGILSSLLGGDVIDKVSDVVDEFTTTDEERLAAELDQYKAETERLSVTQNTTLAEIDAQKARDIAQADINKEEARSSNMWVAGWRPGIGWACLVAVAWFYFLDPASKVVYAMVTGSPFPDPPGIGELMVLLANMLGFGALRTWEKKGGMSDRKFQMPTMRKKK